MGTAILFDQTRPRGDMHLVDLVYSAPKVQLGVDGIVDRIGAGQVGDHLYLVLDYGTRRAWIERGDRSFYAPEAEDGAGTFFQLVDQDMPLNLRRFFAGIERTVSVELNRPGTRFLEIEEYCRSGI